jgi:type IV pilus assembly protein PilO
VRVVLGMLLAANIAAALWVVKPWGGSPEDLAREAGALRRELQERRQTLERLRTLAAKAERAGEQAERFLGEYFLSRRTAYSTLVSELGEAAQKAGIKSKEHAFQDEEVEGSDTLGMLSITANYEGTYADLVEFINLLDRSPRLMIIESLHATPQPSGGILNVTLKVNTFVRDGGHPESAPSELSGPKRVTVARTATEPVEPEGR